MAMKHSLTQEDAMNIVHLRRQGLDRKQIANQLHVCEDTIRRTLKAYDLTKLYVNAWGNFRKHKARKAITLRYEGWSVKEILEHLDIKEHRTLYDYLRFAKRLQDFKDAKKGEEYGVMGKRRTSLKFSDVYLKRAKLGMTCKEISVQAGCHVDTVKIYCRKHKIPKASKEEAQRNRQDMTKTLMARW